jgi:hypothetical protein
MQIKAFSDKILLPDKKDVLKVHLYQKLIQNGIQLFDNDIDMIVELYSFGGYTNSGGQAKFFEICLDKKYKKTEQSIRNSISKCINLGILEKPKNLKLSVSDKFIPNVEFDRLVLQHTISHAK